MLFVLKRNSMLQPASESHRLRKWRSLQGLAPQQVPPIPDICHFFSTDKIVGTSGVLLSHFFGSFVSGKERRSPCTDPQSSSLSSRKQLWWVAPFCIFWYFCPVFFAFFDTFTLFGCCMFCYFCPFYCLFWYYVPFFLLILLPLLKDLDGDMERLVGEAAREAPSLFYFTQYDLDKSVQM